MLQQLTTSISTLLSCVKLAMEKQSDQPTVLHVPPPSPSTEVVMRRTRCVEGCPLHTVWDYPATTNFPCSKAEMLTKALSNPTDHFTCQIWHYNNVPWWARQKHQHCVLGVNCWNWGFVLALSPSCGSDEVGSRWQWLSGAACSPYWHLWCWVMGEGRKILCTSEVHKRMDADSHREPAWLTQPLCASVYLSLPWDP